MSPYPYGDKVLDWLCEKLEEYKKIYESFGSKTMIEIGERKTGLIDSLIDTRKKEILDGEG